MHCFIDAPILYALLSVNEVSLKKIFILAVALTSNFASAATDGFLRYGVMPTYSLFTVVDPNGPTAPGSGYTIFSGVVIMNMGRDSRAFGNFIRDTFSIPATTTNIAQDVTRIGGSVSYQSLFRLSKLWKPWVGVGIGSMSESYKNRYRLTDTGFSVPLSNPERNTNNLFWLVNTSTEWQVNKGWDMGVQLQYEQSVGDDSNVFRVGIYAVY